MIAGILGSHWAGAAYVPLDPKYPQARNRQVLEDAEVAAVLTTGSLHGRLPVGNWAVIDVEELNPTQPAAVEPAETLPGSVAYVLYTSGSTGRPKGVVVSHENLRISTAARLQVYDRPPGRFLLLPSIAFDSSVAGIFWTLATGGALVIPNDEEVLDPRRLTRLLAEEDVSSLLCVPSLYSALLAAAADPAPALEVAIVAGESCPGSLVEEHFRRLPRVRLFNEYGPTEATVWATVHEVGEQDARRPVAIGRPIPGVRVEVLDSNGHPVPAGVPGEAWISGPTVAQGYWRRPELTEECFVPQTDGGEGRRRYRSGDQMAWTLDGRLRFLGRVDEQIKVRGFRIEPGEIEAALGKLPGVGLAAVVARSLDPAAAGDVPAGELVAFVQGSGVGKGWRRELARRLPGQMVPSRLVELTELPRLPNGKIDRQRLSRMPLAAEAGGEPEGSPASDLERSLISLWQALLGVSRIGPDDNFFELGGHSLLVFEMTLALERDLGTSLPPAEVFASPTVRQLARRIGRRVESRSPFRHLFPIQPIGRRIPFIVAIPHFFTDMFAARFRSERPVYGLRGVGLRPEGNLGRWPTMRELGEELVDEIARRFPNESCILAGYSFGASMAVETVRLMEERGLPVHRLYLIAPMPLDVYRLGPLRLQLDDLRRPIGELSVGEALRLYARSNKPWMRRLYGRIWRRLGIEPWRRLHCLAGRLRRWAGLPLTPGMQYADVRVDRFRLHVRYRPRPVHTPTVFFNAREPATDAAATWRPWFQGPFTVRPIPDPHLEDGSIEEARRLILEELQELGDEPC
jgi:amino acid adenylation domain-containing protein